MSTKRISIRIGPLWALMAKEAAKQGLPVATWCSHVLAKHLGESPPDLRAGSAADALTAERARDARWKSKGKEK